MKIDGSALILDINGQPVDTGAGSLTLCEVIQTAALTPLKSDENLPPVAKAALFKIALAAKPADFDLSIEDLATIKTRIGQACTQLVVGRAWELLEDTQQEGK